MNRCYPHPLVAREGWHIIAALAAATIAALLWGSLKTAGVLFSATLIAAYLFRDHVRNIPMQPEAVLSPADGRIASVVRARHPQHGGDTLKISIRTPVWRAYAVRSPAGGSVQCGKNGRRHTLFITLPDGTEITLVQHRGACYAVSGCLFKGERIGFMRWGGRTDVYLPPDAVPCTAIGDYVKASSTVLARLAAKAA